MLKKNKLSIYVIVFSLMMLLFVHYFPKGVIFNSIFQFVRDDYINISDIKIHTTKDWFVISDKDPVILASRKGRISLRFSNMSGATLQSLNNYENYAKSRNLDIKHISYKVGCTNSEAVVTQNDELDNTNETIMLTFHNNLLIQIDFPVDKNIELNEKKVQEFLANNIVCTDMQIAKLGAHRAPSLKCRGGPLRPPGFY